MTKVVLVTGGAGYVGSHTCKALAMAGWHPVAYDDLSRGHASAVKWGPLEIGSLHDQDRLTSVLDKYRPTAIVHFAAFAYVGESMQQPDLYYHNNVGGTVSLLNAMVKTDTRRIIASSSCATYGIAGKDLITEDDRQDPINPYGASKLMVERILTDYAHAYGLHPLILRYFNAAGCDLDGDIGEDHDPEPHVLPRIIMAALGRLPIFEIFGDDYPTDDGTCIRDFVHVSDLARAHVLALEKMVTDGLGGALNLGSTKGYSVREMIDTVARVAGSPVPTQVSPRRPGDPPRLVASAVRAKELLGWEPAHDLTSMVSSALAWMTK